MTGLSLLCSYPKSGNTWLRAVLTEIVGARRERFHDGFAFRVLANRKDFDEMMGIDSADLTVAEIDAARAAYCRCMAEATDRPRIWKVHDCFLAPQPHLQRPFPQDAIAAVVYLVRDPRDVAVSFAHHTGKTIDETIAAMDEGDKRLARGASELRPQVPQYLSSWDRHVESWLDAPGLNLHLMRYEDMIAGPEESFGAAIRFLGLACTPTRLSVALAACRFDALRAREAQEGFRERPARMERFFRRGVAGGWRDSLTADQAQRIEERHGRTMRRLGYLP